LLPSQSNVLLDCNRQPMPGVVHHMFLQVQPSVTKRAAHGVRA
jgi:hypothetical protein